MIIKYDLIVKIMTMYRYNVSVKFKLKKKYLYKKGANIRVFIDNID